MLRSVFYVTGILLVLLAVTMLIPAVIDFSYGNPDWVVFMTSAAVTCFVGAATTLATHQDAGHLDVRTGFLITVTSWFSVGVFGALPLTFSSLHISVSDAVFETFSALTTTGSTVLSGLDTMAPGLLMWRSLLQWLGGVGIVVMALVMLPFLRVGGMQLFRSESSDISDKAAPRVYQVAGVTALVYVTLTVACMMALMAAGMTPFDAVNHAMTAIATGGLSTKDASIGAYQSLPIEIVLIVFMTLGALPLFFYAHLVSHGLKAWKSDPQVPTFLGILLVSIAAMTLWRLQSSDLDFASALRESAFNVTSILTDTGFATTDFSTWGSGAQAMFLILMLVGGCAGSTAGAIKVFRWQLLARAFRSQLVGALSPHRVTIPRYRGQAVSDGMLSSVRNFFFMYMMTWIILTAILMLYGLDMLSAVSSVAQAMANAGPGLGPLVGPGTTFAAVPDPVKWILSLAMVLGRLELTTFYVLLIPDFWRR
jgi:trk system potassium uptake protein TrkH